MVTFRLTDTAHRQLKKIDPQARGQMLEKMRELKKHPSIFSVLEPVHDLEPASHRLRIGEYRLLLRMEGATCIVYKIGHRRDVYK